MAELDDPSVWSHPLGRGQLLRLGAAVALGAPLLTAGQSYASSTRSNQQQVDLTFLNNWGTGDNAHAKVL